MSGTHSVSPRTKFSLFLVLALTLLVYAGSLENEFVLDDSVLIVHNDFVKSWENFPKVFGKEYLTAISAWTSRNKLVGTGEVTYRPVVTMTYFLDYHFWKLNPFGYHLVNLLLHLLCVLLLFYLARALLRNDASALLASLIFAVHPVASETVSVITNRKDMLVFLFYASSFLLFLKGSAKDRGGAKASFLLSLLCFFLALFTKEMAMTLPFMLMLYDYFFVYDQNLKALCTKAPRRYASYFVILLVYAAVWLMLRGGVGDLRETYPYPGGSIYTNLCTMMRVVVVYMGWLIFPFRLHATLVGPASFPASYSLFDLPVLSSVFLVIAFLAAGIAARKKFPLFSFALFWFFLSIVPVLNIIPLPMIMACRYLYVPLSAFSLGLALVLTGAYRYHARFVSSGFMRSLVTIFVIILATAFSFSTIARIPVWKNNFSLCLEHVANYPGVPITHINLAGELRKKGLLKDAVLECEIAISLDPKLPASHNDLGATWLEAGHPEKAAECFIRAIRVSSGFLPAHYNLGLAYAGMQKWDEARRAWQEALQLAPGNEEIKVRLEKLPR